MSVCQCICALLGNYCMLKSYLYIAWWKNYHSISYTTYTYSITGERLVTCVKNKQLN